MCLYTKNTLQKAEKDIECYKILEHYIACTYKIDIFCTPYTNTYVNIKENFKATGEDTVSINNYETLVLTYSEGYIHTYKSLEETIQCIENLNRWNRDPYIKYEIYKCIIPKDTLYVEGKTARDKASYASKEIKFIEKIVI